MQARSIMGTIRKPGQVGAARTILSVFALCAALLVSRGRAFYEEEPANPARPAATILTPAAERLKADVTYLAADVRDGRAPGTSGIEAAADFIADTFKKAGLKPAAGANGYFQRFAISGSPTLGPDQTLAFSGPGGTELKGSPKIDFSPLAIGTAASLANVPVVFVGYGITAKDEAKKLDYDDYAGIDVKGKAVLLIRREPQQGDPASPFDGTGTTRFATFQHKATNAFGHGAVAVLFVNDRAGLGSEKDSLLPFNGAGIDAYSDVSFIMLSRDFADRLLAAASEPSLGQLETQIDTNLKPCSRQLKGWSLTEKISIERHGDRHQERRRGAGRVRSPCR